MRDDWLFPDEPRTLDLSTLNGYLDTCCSTYYVKSNLTSFNNVSVIVTPPAAGSRPTSPTPPRQSAHTNVHSGKFFYNIKKWALKWNY